MVRAFLAGLAMLALAGCASPGLVADNSAAPPTTAATVAAAANDSALTQGQKSLIAACGTYAAGLDTLTTMKIAGVLDAKAVQTINGVVSVVTKVCDPTTPIPGDPAMAAVLVSSTVAPLAQIIAEHSK